MVYFDERQISVLLYNIIAGFRKFVNVGSSGAQRCRRSITQCDQILAIQRQLHAFQFIYNSKQLQ